MQRKKVTCFTNEEEERVAMTAKVPYLVENKLVKQGSILKKKPEHPIVLLMAIF